MSACLDDVSTKVDDMRNKTEVLVLTLAGFTFLSDLLYPSVSFSSQGYLREAKALQSQTEELILTLVSLEKEYPEVLKEIEQERKTETGTNEAGSDLSGEQEITSAQRPKADAMEEDEADDEKEKEKEKKSADEIEKEPKEMEMEKEDVVEKEDELEKEIAVEGGKVDTGAGHLSSMSAARNTEDVEMSEGREAVIEKEADKGEEQSLEKAIFPELAAEAEQRSSGGDQ
jgi:hypothetical protein